MISFYFYCHFKDSIAKHLLRSWDLGVQCVHSQGTVHSIMTFPLSPLSTIPSFIPLEPQGWSCSDIADSFLFSNLLSPITESPPPSFVLFICTKVTSLLSSFLITLNIAASLQLSKHTHILHLPLLCLIFLYRYHAILSNLFLKCLQHNACSVSIS